MSHKIVLLCKVLALYTTGLLVPHSSEVLTGGGLLKRVGGLLALCYLIFSWFIVFTFRNYYILCKTVMHSKKKNFFLLP